MQSLTQTAKSLLAEDGGFSISLAGDFPHSGAMVSIYKDRERIIVIGRHWLRAYAPVNNPA